MNLEAIQRRIAQAAAQAGRPMSDVRLVGISKNQPLEKVLALLRAGLQDIGHNYVQAFIEQAAAIVGAGYSPRWHFVGALQRNKVKKLLQALAPTAPLIHTLDRLTLGQTLNDTAASLNLRVPCLIQIKPATPQKLSADRAGIAADELPGFLKALRDFKHLSVEGLMLLPPADEDPVAHFRALRKLAQTNGLSQLSMGMSDDFEKAIQEGATIVRIGTALFGARQN